MAIDRMIRLKIRGWFFFILCWFLFPYELSSQAQKNGEYQVKAVFLFNFAQFVDWPSIALPEDNSPLVIGILGDDPFGSFLDETIRGEEVKKHPIIVHRFRHVNDIKSCHILFINVPNTDDLIGTLKGKSILTVGDSHNFLQKGGMIRLYTENNKIHMQVNLAAVKAADIDISSKLLRVAEIIKN